MRHGSIFEVLGNTWPVPSWLVEASSLEDLDPEED